MIYSFLYVLVFSVALVLIQKLDVNIPPLFSLFVTATIATIYFNLINRIYLKKMYKNCLGNKKQWVLVMFIVLIMWGTTMIGPGKIGASLFNFIYFSWLGILGLVDLGWQNWEKYKIKFYFALCILTLLSVNVAFELRSSFTINCIYGVFLALLGGTASYVYFKNSQALAKTSNLSATQVLAVRFYLAIFALLIILPKTNFGDYLSIFNITNLTLLAFFSLIIPLYFSRKALEKITPEQHAIINSLCPIVTALLQQFIFNDLKIEQILIYVIYSFLIAGLYCVENYNKKLELNK